MSVNLGPLLSEFDTEERAESYDRWFKEKLRQAMESTSPGWRTTTPWPRSRV